MDRGEFELTRFDEVEEAKIARQDTQLRLRGMWKDPVDGCPHLVKCQEGPYRCDMQDMTVCSYELDKPCEVFQQILDEEWSEVWQNLAEKAGKENELALPKESTPSVSS